MKLHLVCFLLLISSFSLAQRITNSGSFGSVMATHRITGGIGEVVAGPIQSDQKRILQGFSYGSGSTITGVSGEETRVRVFPNPVMNMLTIETPAPATRIVIYNSQGVAVLHNDYQLIHAINVSHLEPGLYLIKVYTNQRSYVRKIIKR
jgi:hypothetical protein